MGSSTYLGPASINGGARGFHTVHLAYNIRFLSSLAMRDSLYVALAAIAANVVHGAYQWQWRWHPGNSCDFQKEGAKNFLGSF